MKKIILTVVAAMTMTFGFAETEENQAVVNNAERYDMSFEQTGRQTAVDCRADGSRRGHQQQPEH